MTSINAQGSCWSCGRSLTTADYGRENRCPNCRKATHSCRNCRFYDPAKANECAEPLVERVVRKEDPNFCDYFEPIDLASSTETPSPEDLLKAAEDLFK